VNINLHLTDTTDLRAEGYVLDGRLFAEVRWGFPDPARLGDGALWGTPPPCGGWPPSPPRPPSRPRRRPPGKPTPPTWRPSEDGWHERAAGRSARVCRAWHPRLPGPLAPPRRRRGRPGLLLPPRPLLRPARQAPAGLARRQGRQLRPRPARVLVAALAAGQHRPGHRDRLRRPGHRRPAGDGRPAPAPAHGGPAAPRAAGGHRGRWLALLVRPQRAR
jgi:hypothetical protein